MPMTNLIKVCAQCGQTGRNADKIAHHTSEFNYVRMVLHCALVSLGGRFGMTAEEQQQYSQWDVIAEEEGFVVVFPEGVPDSPSQLRKESFSDNKILVHAWTD